MASTQNSDKPAPNDNDESSRDRSAESSVPASREGSRATKKKHNVRFTPGGESLDTSNQRAPFDLRDDTNAPPKPKPLPKPRLAPGSLQGSGISSSIRRYHSEDSEDITDETVRAPVSKVRPSFMRPPSSSLSNYGEYRPYGQQNSQKEGAMTKEDNDDDEVEQDEDAPAKALSQKSAQDRAERLSRMIGSHSAPGSRYTSPHRPQRPLARSPPPSPPPDGQGGMPIDLNDIPLEKLESKRTKYGIEDDTDEDEEGDPERKPSKKNQKRSSRLLKAAARVVGHKTGEEKQKQYRPRVKSPEPPSGTQTPIYERDPDHYVPKPTEYREGYLSSLLKLYDQEGLGSAIAHIPTGPGGAARAARRSNSRLSLLNPISQDGAADTPGQSPATTPGGSPTSSGATTPKQKHRKWYDKSPASQSTGALSDLVSSSTVLAQPGGSKQSSVVRPKPKHRPLSHQAIDTMLGKNKRVKGDESTLIQHRMAETMQIHGYLLKMCRALMSYGAPTHRLEGEPWYNSYFIHSYS